MFMVYGIDLGTTNSCIARCEGEDTRIFPNNDQMNVTPSAVHMLKSGRILVGLRARNAAINDPENVATEFKRLMGQNYQKIFPATGKHLSAEELSAEVLKSMKEDVKRLTGDSFEAAVITVPAAFGTLQCEATSRAAQLAGIKEVVLLQEPVAAAIAYGVKEGARDQYWLVLDLGGGTYDVAVVSTRGGRLTVLEHRGDNFLGGKDIDRALVDRLLVPALREQFRLPPGAELASTRLFRMLLHLAEGAKIDLSTSSEVILSDYDIGVDLEGKPVELEMTITRAQLEGLMEPLVARCVTLAEEALQGVGITASDLDRVFLVGGPTQTPYFREAVAAALGIKNLDFSLDPMTVVARGAALFATTVRQSVSGKKPAPGGKLPLQLEYKPISPALQCPVVGKVDLRQYPGGAVELKFDVEGGFWSSGWFPVDGVTGLFKATVQLREGKRNRFFIYARDQHGNLLPTEPEEFAIRHGLAAADPILPRSISVEVYNKEGRTELDPLFERGSILPLEKTIKYLSHKAIWPHDPEGVLIIKLWEGEEFSNPQANEWIRNIRLRGEAFRRPFPAGEEVELTFSIDASRRIRVEAFIPYLNQHFSPQEITIPLEKDVFEQLKEYHGQFESLYDLLEALRSRMPEDDKCWEEFYVLQKAVEELDLEIASLIKDRNNDRSDDAARAAARFRQLCSDLARLEKMAGSVEDSEDHAAGVLESTERAVEELGGESEQREMLLLKREYEKSRARGSKRDINRAVEGLNSLRWRVLARQPWFWTAMFTQLPKDVNRYRDAVEAQKWLEAGENASAGGDAETLETAVRNLWNLLEPDEMVKVRESALPPGLRRR